MKNPIVISTLTLLLICSGIQSPVIGQNFMPDQYLFGPSAIPMEKGEVRYRNNGITVNSLHAGISDHLSVDAGFELLLSSMLILLDRGGFISFANVKYGHSFQENFHLGGGVFVGGMLSSDVYNRSGFVSPYGVATFGNHLNNFSLAIGTPIGTDYHPSFLMLSGKLNLGRRLDFISENYYLLQSSDSHHLSVNGDRKEGGKSISRYIVSSFAVRIYSRTGNLDLGISNFHSAHYTSFLDENSPSGRTRLTSNQFWFPIPIPIVAFTMSFN